MKNKYLNRNSWISLLLLAILIFGSFSTVYGQVNGPQRIKWMWIGDLRHWFSNGGAEIEFGRRSRAYTNTDQNDGLRYPALYTYQDHSAGQSLWIGCTNFKNDPLSGQDYAYKVVSIGRLFLNIGTDTHPEEFKMIGKFEHPSVMVDGVPATDLDLNDLVDEIDPDLPCERMLVNKFHTPLGITVLRKIYAYSQEDNDNYYIYDYTFTNTGIIDGTFQPKRNETLTDVVFHFQYRLAFANEAFRKGWAQTGASWGRNTINVAFGEDPNSDEYKDYGRGCYAYYGPHSNIGSWDEDFGAPNHSNGYILSATQYAGAGVLHADKSATDHSDDPYQPETTQFLGQDRDAQANSQIDANLMAKKYGFMTMGHPHPNHEELVLAGSGFADTYGGDQGGYAPCQGFGPYPTMAPGESIHIVLAQAIAAINRQKNREVSNNWFNNITANFVMPDGSTTGDRNTYKNAWVLTGLDSLHQTLNNARAAFDNDFKIPDPPPPPEAVEVNSGGDRITVKWAQNPDSYQNIDGYRVYRAIGRPDTLFEMVYECSAANPAEIEGDMYAYVDKTARRGFDYYYYVQSKDDGSVDPNGKILVSGKFYTITNMPASLKRPAGTALDQVIVVPNPYVIKSQSLQFGVDTPDRLAFYNIPPYCVIKIYTERGDLIKTLDHTDTSGDEMWDSLTESRQVIVSGLYIAYFEVTQNYDDPETGERLFTKGENTFRKFVVIR